MPKKDWLRSRFSDFEMAALRVISLFPLHVLRRGAVRLFGASIASGVTLYHNFEIRQARSLTIGGNSSIGNGAILDARGGLTIGASVNLSTDVNIWTGQHDWRSTDFAYSSAPVVIGDRAWLSTRVTVLPGVTIGAGAVVAAGAVVTKDVAPNDLVAGVPARPVARRPDVSYDLGPSRHKPWWW